MAVEIAAQAKDFDQDFIRVSCHALASSVCDEALAWVRAIAQTMRELDAVTEAALRDKIAKYQAALHRPPSTLEELKQVLNTVNIIRCKLGGERVEGKEEPQGVTRFILRHQAASAAAVLE